MPPQQLRIISKRFQQGFNIRNIHSTVVILILEDLQASLTSHLLILVHLGGSMQAGSFEIITSLNSIKVVTNHVLSDKELHQGHLVDFHLENS